MADMKELPLGLGMALAKNAQAMAYFSGLSEAQQREIVEATHTISSKQEMRAYVDSLFQSRPTL